jgi:hypothetical protein
VCAIATELWSDDTEVDSLIFNDGVNPRAMHQLGDYYEFMGDGLKWSTWYLTGASVGDNRSLHVTFRNSVPRTSTIGCVSYSGVDQNNPFADISENVSPGAPASLTITSDRDGSMPWAHIFSTNNPSTPVSGIHITQATSPGQFSYLVDGGSTVPAGASHTFEWNVNGHPGAEGAMIRPSIAP